MSLRNYKRNYDRKLIFQKYKNIGVPQICTYLK